MTYLESLGNTIPKDNFGVYSQRGFIYQNRYAVLYCVLMLYDESYKRVDKIFTEFHEDIILNRDDRFLIIQTKTNQNVFSINNRDIIQTLINFNVLESKFGKEIEGYYIIAENGFSGIYPDCVLSDYLSLHSINENNRKKLSENKFDQKVLSKILLKKGLPFDYLFDIVELNFQKKGIYLNTHILEKIYRVIIDRVIGESERKKSVYTLELNDIKNIIKDKSLTRKELLKIINESVIVKENFSELESINSATKPRNHFSNTKNKLLQRIKNDLDSENKNLQKSAASTFYMISLEDAVANEKDVWYIVKKLISWNDRNFVLEGLLSFYNILNNSKDTGGIHEIEDITILKRRVIELEQINLKDRISEDCFRILVKILEPAELSDFCFNRLKYAIINVDSEYEYSKYIAKFTNFFEQNRRETLPDELHEIIENHQSMAVNRALPLYEYFLRKYYS